MTSPPEPAPAEATTTAALAVQVAALRGQVRLIFARLDKAGITGDLNLADRLADLARAVTQSFDSPPRGPPPPTGSASTPLSTPHSSLSSASGPTRSCAANTAATSSPTAGPTTRTSSGNCPPWPPNGTAPTAAAGPAWTGRWNSMTGGCPAPCAASPTSPAGATPNALPGHEP